MNMSQTTLSSLELTELSMGLHRLARNLWWTWNQDAQEIFFELSPRGWQNLHHNAVAILHEVSEYELRVRLQDHDFAARVVISYCDIEEKAYTQTITIGKENKKRSSRIHHLQLIQEAMSRKQV